MIKRMNGEERLKLQGATGVIVTLGLLVWGASHPAAGGTSSSISSQRTITLQSVTPTPFTNPTATPPSQGGRGHDLFHLYCSSCHGDVGQGLTDEFRLREYPPEDTNCWNSGCHGPRPYDNGFVLPKTVPALIGPGTLQRFSTAQQMHAFIRASMPFNAPGSLSDEQYLELTAFLLEQNHVTADETALNVTALPDIALHPDALPDVRVAPAVVTNDNSSWPLFAVVLLFGLTVIVYLVRRSRSSRPPH